MEQKSHKLRMAYYDGSDGPRIMLFGPHDADFKSLQEIFRALSQNQGPFELHRLPFIETYGSVQLSLSCSGFMFRELKGKPQGIRRNPSADHIEFNWQRTAEGWDYLAELIEGLLSNSKPGHQYLSSYPNEDAIIVLSKGEYCDKIVKQLTPPSA